MVFFAEISSLDFPKNFVYTKYLKLLTILIEYLPAIFSQCLSLRMFAANEKVFKLFF